VFSAVSEDEWRCLALVAAAESQRLMAPNGGGMAGLTSPALRTPPTPLGAPLILSPRMQVQNSGHMMNGQGAPQPLMSPADGLIYTPYAEYANYAASLTSPLLTEYTAEHAAGGLFAR